MKLCIPTMDGSGLAAEASGHFGSAPYFTLVDTESGRCEVISNQRHQHRHGACDPIRHLGPGDFEAVVCRGMGRRALSSLARVGVDVFVTDGETVSDIVTAAREGRLSRLSSTDACGGHEEGRSGCRQEGR
jgi:predicted Fe-Mo cluster-binding NifX family protein